MVANAWNMRLTDGCVEPGVSGSWADSLAVSVDEWSISEQKPVEMGFSDVSLPEPNVDSRPVLYMYPAVYRAQIVLTRRDKTLNVARPASL